MIIGNGLIAQFFKNDFSQSEKIILFASGVSDSQCKDQTQFKREEKLLNQYLNDIEKVHLFIYFSTISIYDPSRNLSLYVKHKLKMESLILNYPKTKIFRIGQVASKSLGNNNNLLNFINNAMNENKKIELWGNSYRSIIDIKDVVNIIKHIITKSNIRSKIINISNPHLYSMIEIIKTFEKIKNHKAKYILLNKGEVYRFNTGHIDSIIFDCKINFNEMYLEKVIRKYYW